MISIRHLRAWLVRLAGLFNKRERDRELAEELESHLHMHIEDNLRAGMGTSEARRQALIKLGGREQVKEGYRDRRGLPVLETTLQDLRYGARTLRRQPGFTLIAMLTLSLGIGANTAIFTVVNALLLRPLPYPEAERLTVVASTVRREQVEVRSISYPDFIDWRDQNTSFEQMAARYSTSFTLLSAGEPERVNGELVSASYFPILGVRTAYGRTFLPEEDRMPDTQRVAVVGYGLWQRRFGESTLVGQTIQLSDGTYTVVGVMPEGFRGISDQAELWLPMMMSSSVRDAGLQKRNERWFSAVARLKPGVSLQQAQGEMDTIASQLEQAHPDSNTNRGALVTPLHENLFGSLQLTLWILLGAVGCVLVVACTNVANLLLQRATARQKETAIRLALGATTGRLIRQLLTESLLLALCSGVLGVLVAFWSVGFLVALSPITFPSFVKLTLDSQVLGFSLLISVVTGILFGLAPALQAARPAVNEVLKDAGRGSSGGLGRSRLLGALVVSEIALALVLLIGAGLMIRSLQRLQAIDLGFDSDHLVTMRVSLPSQKYQRTQMDAFSQQLRDRLQALPGAQAVSLSSDLPFGGSTSAGPIVLEGQTAAPAGSEIRIYRHSVTPQFFATLGIPLVQGRDFTASDHEQAPAVVIVSEALARRYWSNEDPIGKRLKETGASDHPWRSIVGVVPDVKYRRLAQNPDADPDIYLPLLQRANHNLSLAVRTEGDPTSLTAAIRSELQKLAPDLPIFNVTTMAEQMGRQTTQARFSTWMLGIFGSLALLLAAVGVYSVMAYAVEQRTHELGIRIALGAHASDVLKLVIGHGIRLASLGVALGLTAALALTQLMKGLLFGVAAADPPTYASIALLLMAVALVACYIPARRATKVDPIVALRYE